MDKITIGICIGSACFARGNARIVEAVEKYMKIHECRHLIELNIRGELCSGRCADGPNITVNEEVYHCVTPERIVELLDQYMEKYRGRK